MSICLEPSITAEFFIVHSPDSCKNIVILIIEVFLCLASSIEDRIWNFYVTDQGLRNYYFSKIEFEF